MSLWKRFSWKKAPGGPGPEPAAGAANRRIRVFISSTFRDMIAERDVLMTHTWPALRRLCQERHVELVEVDLRWGIAESQSTRRETLKLCLDEIRSCRPYFLGLLGERYGWVPDDEAFTADVQEEQPWLASMRGRSVTELEMLHGVLNNPGMAGRAFFYFRDPAYARDRGPGFLSESDVDAERLSALKTLIRTTCAATRIPLRENYLHPSDLAAMVLTDLSAAIDAQFPKENLPDQLTREAQDHEAFAEMRRRTYIGRAEYVEALDRHAAGDGGPLAVLGDSGSGKSALLANWLAHWREGHPGDFIVQHFIGGTADSADPWRLMTRLMAEIKRRSGDPEALPSGHDEIVTEFPRWLSKGRAKAAHDGVRFILVLDALNQLDDRDHARLLGWLPDHSLSGPLRLIVSTLPGTGGGDDPIEAIRKRRWPEFHIQPLTVDERRRMIAGYLARFGKTLDEHRLARLAAAATAANPLYLKILLDELRVTGTHDRLDERLTDYLAAADIPALLQQVLSRYQRDYESDRPGLVAEALGLIYAARRGLSESELLQLLRPADQERLPPATWAPLRAALEDALVDRGGILNFAHDYLRAAVGQAFAPAMERRTDLRLQLAAYFEARPATPRACDELPWLLKESGARDRLRACLLDIDRFLLIHNRDKDELRGYWVDPLGEQQAMGTAYVLSYEQWSRQPGREDADIAFAANRLGFFLLAAALHAEAEPLLRRSLDISERGSGKGRANVALDLANLASLLQATNRSADAEPLLRRALECDEHAFGKDDPRVARALNNLAGLLKETSRPAEAEPLVRRALGISERSLGKDHPEVALHLNNLAGLLQATKRLADAEPLYRRALEIDERSFGTHHPTIAIRLNNLATLLQATNRPAEAEPLMRRALEIDERGFGADHPNVARDLHNLSSLLADARRLAEAEPLIRRALASDERSLGNDHPMVAMHLNELAQELQAANRLAEAEPLLRRSVEILVRSSRSAGHPHPHLYAAANNYGGILEAMGRSREDIIAVLQRLAPELFQGA